MSMVPLGGLLSSTAGTALSQATGSDTERTQKEGVAQRRSADADQHAEQSAGIGQTEQDQQTSERDADGRRLWEKAPAPKPVNESVADKEADSRQSKDPTGQSGTKLDLTG
jgi:hypothetical protein